MSRGRGEESLLAACNTDPKQLEVALSSVITQVTKRDSTPPPGPRINPYGAALGPSHIGAPGRQRHSIGVNWTSRLRGLFCCLGPSAGSDAYVRGERDSLTTAANGGAGVIHSVGCMQLPKAPPLPPSARYRGNLIGAKRPEDAQKKTLVLDLDETLVHSSFKPIPHPDYVLPVEIDGKMVDVYVLKRPWMDYFMEAVGHRYEVVVFTASLAKYADPLLDLLDKSKVVRWRLFREACMPYEGNYVKDLSCLGRELQDVIIVDNSPHSYVFQPANALPISTFIDNMEDQELLDLLPVLAQTELASDVRPVLARYWPPSPG